MTAPENMQKTIRIILGIMLIILGVLAALTPFSPGSWLALIGLEVLGLRVLLQRKFLSLLPPKYRGKVRALSKKMKPKRKKEKMSDWSFKLMNLIFCVMDFVYPYIEKRIKKFGIQPGMTVVDYGCGPGRYTIRFTKLVGRQGKVFAIDIHELAIEAVKKKLEKYELKNVEPVLAKGYDSRLPDHIADVVCAIDMFHIIKNHTELLAELKRITKTDGVLVIDDGHQRRSITKSSILESSHWDIFKETHDHLKCKPTSV